MAIATKRPGCFIVVEGVDGAGKTTIVQQLVLRLNQDAALLDHLGYASAINVREPGTTQFGLGLRSLLLESEKPLEPMTEVLAFLAAKAQLMEEVIKPAIYNGHIVVCDRYTRSLLAYQGALRGIPSQTLVDLLGLSGLLISPNLELFLTVSEEVANARRSIDLNRMDILARERAQDLREGYRNASQALPPYRSIEINSEGSVEDVFAHVYTEVTRYLKFHRAAGLSLSQPLPSYISEPAPILIEPVKPSTVPQESTHEPAFEQGDIAA